MTPRRAGYGPGNYPAPGIFRLPALPTPDSPFSSSQISSPSLRVQSRLKPPGGAVPRLQLGSSTGISRDGRRDSLTNSLRQAEIRDESVAYRREPSPFSVSSLPLKNSTKRGKALDASALSKLVS